MSDHVRNSFYAPHLAGWANYRPGQGEISVQKLEAMYYRELVELCVNRFEWSGLPVEIDKRFLEMTLFFHALAVVAESPTGANLFVYKATPQGAHNLYDNPVKFRTVGTPLAPSRTLAYSESRTLTECVPIWANYLRIPDLDIVSIYARRLAEIDRTLDINVVNARHPKVFSGDGNMRLSAVNAVRQIDSGASFLQVSSQLADSLSALDMGVDPDSFEKLHILRARIYNECMGLLGIENANQDKKERLIEGELEANQEQTSLARGINLNARQEAAQHINEVYGLDVSVSYRGSLDTSFLGSVEGGEGL